MAKILSQAEIDELLTTVSTGEQEAVEDPAITSRKSLVVYDFKHPNRVSKDQVRTLENMHDNFAGHYGSTLSAIMRTIVDVDLVSVDQITYSEFIMSLVAPSCTYTIKVPPLEGVCLIDFNPTLTFSFIDRMFGGNGKILETERELTGIERSVMGRLSKKLYRDLEKSWEHIVEVNIEQHSFETNPQFIQIIPPTETVVVVSFQLKLFQSTGLLTICYPYISLEPIIMKLSAQNWIDSLKKKSFEVERKVNMSNMGIIEADITAELLNTDLKLGEFLKLRKGDVIRSEKKISQPVSVIVNNRRKFLAKPGLSGRKRAFQIVEVTRDSE
ncbi:MAG: flagellar motor switch protein FliM [candidate division Zixibacteria bacterium]|nr:flagellar motor switch protein FliM [candidate division Zixibacteria bacterium]